MTPRQKKFCELYVQSLNASEAARGAGYSEHTAGSIGSENLTKPEIRDYIHRLVDEAAELRIASVIEAQAVWSDILRDTSQKASDRLRAGELLARATGAFLRAREADKVPASTGSGNWDDIIYYDTEADLEAALAARKDGDDGFVICLPRLETIVKDDEDGEDEEEP